MKENITKYSLVGCALALGLSLGLSSCRDLSDEDYFKQSAVRNTNAAVTSSSESVSDYIQERADLSQMSDLLRSTGVFDEMTTTGELHTILVVADGGFKAPDAESALKIARSHVAPIGVAPSKLNDGDRLKMLNGKNITISMDSLAREGELIGHVRFNTSTLKEVIKVNDGYVYVIDSLITIPTSLQDYIDGLDDRYSIFKEMVTSSGYWDFQKSKSKIIGIDAYGNTLYDSVFVYVNSFFDAKNFSLSSEALTATMLLFSDEVIEKALSDARAKYHAWGYDHKIALLRNGSLDSVYVGYSSDEDLKKWILEAAFYRKKYSADDIQAASLSAKPDLNSIYDRKWRTSVQKLDLEHPVELSNGIAYEVKEFRIPNTRLIYRLHEEFRTYEYCSEKELAQYFKTQNLSDFKVSANAVGEWTPCAGVWPLHGNSPLTCKPADTSTPHAQLDYTPIFSRSNASGGYDVHVLMVPPGTYRMAFGSKEKQTYKFTVQLFALDASATPVACGDPVLLTLDDGTTTWNYDRGNTLSNRLPEYYDMNDSRNTAGSKNGYYWTDGGAVYSEVTVPDLKGDGSALQLLIRISSEDCAAAGTFYLNHWCLRPTENNY